MTAGEVKTLSPFVPAKAGTQTLRSASPRNRNAKLFGTIANERDSGAAKPVPVAVPSPLEGEGYDSVSTNDVG